MFLMKWRKKKMTALVTARSHDDDDVINKNNIKRKLCKLSRDFLHFILAHHFQFHCRTLPKGRGKMRVFYESHPLSLIM